MTDDWKIIAATEKKEYFFPGDMPPPAKLESLGDLDGKLIVVRLTEKGEIDAISAEG